MILLQVIIFLLALVLIYAAVAYRIYQRVIPAQHACRDCANPVTVKTYQLFYRELGVDKGNPPVVLVHGGPGHSSLSFKDGFDFLSARGRVIFYDQRGSGNSQTSLKTSDYSIEQLVEELETLRSEVILAEKIILIGHSFGGALSQRYTLKYPEHVAKLVLVGSIRINNGMSNRFVWKWFGPALYSTAMGFPPHDAQAADQWFTQSGDRDNPKRLFDAQRTDLLQNSGPVSFAPWREISFSLVGPDFKAELSQLKTPTLCVYGAADSPYTGKPAATELAALLPNSSLAGFDKSGHWPFLEEPQKFQQVLSDFLVK